MLKYLLENESNKEYNRFAKCNPYLTNEQMRYGNKTQAIKRYRRTGSPVGEG